MNRGIEKSSFFFLTQRRSIRIEPDLPQHCFWHCMRNGCGFGHKSSKHILCRRITAVLSQSVYGPSTCSAAVMRMHVLCWLVGWLKAVIAFDAFQHATTKSQSDVFPVRPWTTARHGKLTQYWKSNPIPLLHPSGGIPHLTPSWSACARSLATRLDHYRVRVKWNAPHAGLVRSSSSQIHQCSSHTLTTRLTKRARAQDNRSLGIIFTCFVRAMVG